MEKSKKRSLYYCLFDWANSPFSVVVITFIFSSYFTNKIADDKISGMSLWGWAIAVSGKDVHRDGSDTMLFSLVCR